MKRTLVILFSAALALLLVAANRANKDAKSIFTVELSSPQKSLDSLQTLNVSFYQPIAAAQASKMLRVQIDAVINVYQPANDVLATAFNESEDVMKDVSSLIYSKKFKKVMTMEEYREAAK